MLMKYTDYRSIHKKVEEPGVLRNIFEEEKPDIVIHLAAQAGVRYSIDNPRSYLESNIVGTFELLKLLANPPKHILLASTSSAYGANKEMPYREIDKADHQMSFYAPPKNRQKSWHIATHIYLIYQ